MNSFNRYCWSHLPSASVVGTTWNNGICLSSAELAKIVSSIVTFEQFNQLVKGITGHFTIIKKVSEGYWVATDPILHYPLFYKKVKGQITLSDDPIFLTQGENIVPDRQAALFFLQFGATFCNRTLVEGLSIFEPGTITKLSETNIETEHYVKDYFLSEENWEHRPDELRDLLDGIFARYLEPFKDRFFAIPLTAGYDSRLIATMLKKYGIKNVHCFTWGRKDNIETITASKIASQLGFNYRFIEYNNRLIADFDHQEIFSQYMEYAGNYLSMPYMQDYFAVKYLKEQQLIPEDAIFIPGHTGDVYSGSHQRPWYQNLSKREIANEITDHFAITGFKSKPLQKEAILSLLQQYLDDAAFSSTQFVDYWDITVRQARFVARSSSVFQFFGYDVLLPLSDQQFIRYFFSAPTEMRYNEKIYRDCLVEYFFKPFSVDVNLKAPSDFRKDSGLVKFLKNNAPQFFKRMYYPLDDDIFYREITQQLINGLGKKEVMIPDFPFSYNSFLIQWYLYFIFGWDCKNFFREK
ncbi:MAG TPA: asparagine synthase-related protein [Prolixibacteraceae bacterium]|nr:asparagine synthase-related protein [Prolixibacteraceae bacterium]HPS14037.1 asparagine synthase-related protein [Prolixibacteraceae bacterium]